MTAHAQDTQHLIGSFLAPEVGRDAIHIAVAPAECAVGYLRPGESVGLNEEGQAIDAVPEKALGIVDPYLLLPVRRGQRFFIFLFPNTITSLRHVWTHPGVDNEPEAPGDNVSRLQRVVAQENSKAASEQWLKDKAENLDLTLSGLISAARLFIEQDEVTVQHGRENWRDDFGNPEEFWMHYERVYGKVPNSDFDRTRNIFSCSC